MHVESLSALRTKSSTTPANRKLVTIRSSGRLRPVPKQRSAEATPSLKKSARAGEAQAAASEAAEKCALHWLCCQYAERRIMSIQDTECTACSA